MESHVTIPTLVEVSTVTPDIPTETTPEPEAEPVEDTTPSEMPVTAVGTEEEKEPADAQTETEAGNEPATDDAVKTKPKKTRRNKAGADDEEWLAWLDECKAQNETPTSTKGGGGWIGFEQQHRQKVSRTYQERTSGKVLNMEHHSMSAGEFKDRYGVTPQEVQDALDENRRRVARKLSEWGYGLGGGRGHVRCGRGTTQGRSAPVGVL